MPFKLPYRIVRLPYGGSSAGPPLGSVGGFATFDPSTANQVSVSNGNLTGTSTFAGATAAGVQVGAGSAKASGKYYFEITITTVTSTNINGNDGFGVLGTGNTYTNTNAAAGAVYYTPGSGITTDGGLGSGSLAGGLNGAGQAFGVAVDLNNSLIWFVALPGPQQGVGLGPWNGAAVNGNPASGIGGFQLPATSLVPFLKFGGTGGQTGAAFTANFGASAFIISAVPSGFNAGWSV